MPSLQVASIPRAKTVRFLQAADSSATAEAPQLVRRRSVARDRLQPGMAKKAPPFYVPFLLVLSLNVLVISGALFFYALIRFL